MATAVITSGIDQSGLVQFGSSGASFATLRAGAGNFYANSTSANNVADYQPSSAMNRGIYKFDTSSIPIGSTVNTVTLSLWFRSGPTTNAGGNTPFCIVSAAPASTSSFANTDYSTLGSTLFGSIDFSSLTLDAYNDITLNPAGKSYINLGGITSIGTLLGWDFYNSYTGTGRSTYNTYLNYGGSNPTITIDYTLPLSTLTGIQSLTGVSSLTFS